MEWVFVAIEALSIGYALYVMNKLRSSPAGLTIQGPTAGEGTAIPWVFGTCQLPNPNTCWFGNQYDEKSGDNHYYSMDVQVGLCHGPIDALIDVVTNGKRTMSHGSDPSHATDPVTVDGTEIKAGQLGVHPDSSKFSMTAKVRMGGIYSSPGADPGVADDMAKAMGLTTGPRYNGVARLEGKVRLGISPIFMPVEAIVQRIHKKTGGATQWYDAKAEISSGRAIGDLWKYKLQSASDYSDWSGVSYDDSSWTEAAGPISNAIACAQLFSYNDYPLPLVKTQLPVDGTIILDGGTFYYGNKFSGGKVQEGCKLWLRWNLGPLPPINLFAQLWHDDSAKLFFNGTEIAVTPTVIDSIPNNSHHNSTAAIDASLINTSSDNIIAMRVMDSYQSVFGSFSRGAKTGTSQLIYAGLQIGNDTSVPGKLVDMNPAHIIHEAYTDPRLGMGYNDSDLDDDAFKAAADTLYNERFGLSLQWSQQSSIDDFVNEILRHISGVRYVDQTTGKIVLKLIRNDYTVGDLLVLDESRVVKIEDVNRKAIGELINSVKVTYSATPRGDKGSLTIFEEGLLQLQGGVVTATVDYPGVTNSFIAGNLALRDLRLGCTPLRPCTVYASRHAAELNLGDAFVLDWPDLGFDHAVMRVLTIDRGNSTETVVKITCLEDVFSYPNQRITTTNNPIAKPIGPIQSTTTAHDTYHTCKLVDARNKGNCICAFSASTWAGTGSVFSTFDEISPGVMERTFEGPLTAEMFDGIDPGTYSTGGTSWLLGQRVFPLALAGDISGGKKYQGPYIVDDVGGHYEDYGLPTQRYVTTKARMHRDPAFSASAQFTAEATFRMLGGTTYGGHHLQLANAPLVLGTTESNWTDLGDSITWTDDVALLKTSELAGKAIPADTLDTSVIMANGTADMTGFSTSVGQPGTRVIPAGPWVFNCEAVWLDPDMAGDVGSITSLGLKIWRSRTTTGDLLFEILSAQITATVPTPLPAIKYDGPQYLLDPTDRIVEIPTIHTDSTTPVKLWFRYNSPMLLTTVDIPLAIAGDPTVIVQPPAPITVQASAMTLDGPSKFVQLGGDGNKIPAIGLPHGSNFGAYMSIQVPSASATGTMTIRPVWAPAITMNSGAVRWQVTVSVVGAAALTTPGTATAWTGIAATAPSPFVTDTPITEAGTKVTAVAQGSWLRIEIKRLGTDGEDTYTGQANLLGLQIDY